MWKSKCPKRQRWSKKPREFTHRFQALIFCSAELIDARKYKSNQQEYDAFAKIINKHPDRATSNAEIAKIKEDVDALTIGILR